MEFKGIPNLGWCLLIAGIWWWRSKTTANTLSGWSIAKKVVYYYADWCPACRQYGPKLDTWAARHGVVVEKFQVKSWQDEIVKKINITSLPFTVVDGAVVNYKQLIRE